MKNKVLCLVLVLGLLSAPAFGRGPIKTYEWDNTSTGYAVKAIPTTTIIPGRDKIYGFTVMNPDIGSGSCEVGLYDIVDNGEGTGQVIGETISEAESPVDSDKTVWFLYYRTITTQLNLHASSGARVLVYFGR